MAKRQERQVIKKPETNTVENILPVKYRLKCKNHNQKDFANLIAEKEIVIASGPAGVGKSYVAVAVAIELLQDKTNPYKKILISTPAEEAGESLGYLPGNLREKMEPYLASTLSIFDKIIGKNKRLLLEESEIIQIQPLGFIRGESIDNTIFLMEEAQNMTPAQMKTLLTRIGENSKFIISGDLDQSDRFKRIEQTGLYDALNRHKNVEAIGFIEFSTKDIVRNPLISKILDNYKNDDTIGKVNVTKDFSKAKSVVKEEPKTNTFNRIKTWFLKNFKW